jgi:hypothetical protein
VSSPVSLSFLVFALTSFFDHPSGRTKSPFYAPGTAVAHVRERGPDESTGQRSRRTSSTGGGRLAPGEPDRSRLLLRPTPRLGFGRDRSVADILCFVFLLFFFFFFFF